MKFTHTLLVIAALATGSAAAASAPPAGVWANPHNSVHVAFKRCGRAMCGTVVWANAKAQADAAHRQVRIRATVAPAPYHEWARTQYRAN